MYYKNNPVKKRSVMYTIHTYVVCMCYVIKKQNDQYTTV